MFYLTTNNHIVVAVGETAGEIRTITELEYSEIMELLANKPKSDDPRYDYRLKDDLELELFEIEPDTPREELTDEEALNILTGETP